MESSMNQPPKPDNHLVWAILTTIFCCLPLGIVSIVKSSKVNELYAQGNYMEAEQASRDAKKWAMWSAIVSGIFIILCILLVILGVAGGILSNGY